MADFLSEVYLPREALDLATRRYLEMVFCDEMDMYIYLFGFAKRFMRRVKFEGLENLKEAKKNRTVLLLSSHFGGGFWVLPYLKSQGIVVQCLSADHRKQDYASQMVMYYYLQLRMFAVEKACGTKIIYKTGARPKITKGLEEGRWILMLYDVPSFMIREKLELPFLGRRAWFSKGTATLSREMEAPLFFFFSYLDEGDQRRICFEKPIHVDDDEKAIKTCASLVEKRVMERPDHWHFWPVADQFFVPTDKDREPSLQ